jgi:hypothetical protein
MKKCVRSEPDFGRSLSTDGEMASLEVDGGSVVTSTSACSRDDH